MKKLKLTSIIIIFLCMYIKLHAQTPILNREIEIPKTNISGYELIKYIESETGCSINYSESVLKITETISFTSKKGSVKYFLDKIFEQQQVEYIVKEKKILVKLKINSQGSQGNKTSNNSRDFISISGKVIEYKTNIPVGFASISIKNQAIGTVTNIEGVFMFHLPQACYNDTLLVSAMGYQSYSKAVNEVINKDLDIELVPKVYTLTEAKVKPLDPLEIIEKAIAKIPENYPTEPINMDAFYREMTFENDTCVEMAEAACEFYYRPYGEKFNRSEAVKNCYQRNRINFDEFYFSLALFSFGAINPGDRMRIIEARSSNLQHKHRFKVVPLGGPWTLIGNDWVKQGFAFDDKFADKHKFTLMDIIEYEGKPAYKIYADPKPWYKKYHQILFIDIETYAIAAIEYYIPEFEYKTDMFWTPALYYKKKSKCEDNIILKSGKVTTKYKKIKGKWYLCYINKSRAFEHVFSDKYIYKNTEDKISYKMQLELLINHIEQKNVKSLPDSTEYQSSIYWLLSEYDLDYNKAFWENYNTIALTPLQDSIRKQLEQNQSIEQQFAQRNIKNDSLDVPISIKTPTINPHTKLQDDYFWMQDENNPEVLKYVEEENRYTKNYMMPLKHIERNLYTEMTKRYKEDTTKLPEKIKNGEYEYYYKAGKESNILNIYRKKTNKNSSEELVLDIEKKSQFHPNYWAEIASISPNNEIFAYTEPITDGYDSRTVFKELKTDMNIDSLEKASNVIWEADSKSFLYLNWDETNWDNKIFRHKIGNNRELDELIYGEKNKSNNVSIRQYDKKYILIESSNDYYDNELYLLKHENDKSDLLKLCPQQRAYSHSIKIKNDTLFSLTKEPDGKTCIYFSSMEVPEKENWKKIIENAENEYFHNYLILDSYIVLIVKENMQSTIKIIDRKGNNIDVIEFEDEETYTIGFENNNDLQSNIFRYSYSSLTTPKQVFELDINKKQKTLIKQNIPIGYSTKNYITKLLWATSNDGVKVPMSIVYNKKLVKRNGKSPVVLYAYGSYGASTDPGFSPMSLSLLDRGFVYAIAHVRGGDELGQMWHENAMQLKKKNTFNDYIACAEQLIKDEYTTKGKIVARGGSAGGLTMGAIVNMQPELFNTVILESPYLDVLSSLSDTTAKFSFLERVQLGDPTNPETYNYIKSYSPYQNIEKQAYPNMLFTAGLLDDRVECYNSLKSVAKLRDLKTDKNVLLLKTDLYAGHNGYVDNNSMMLYDAFVYAFILNNLGVKY